MDNSANTSTVTVPSGEFAGAVAFRSDRDAPGTVARIGAEPSAEPDPADTYDLWDNVPV